MPHEYHALVISLLPRPWTLSRYEVTTLEGVLEATPGFAAAVTAAGVDPTALLAAVAAATPAEKLTLVDPPEATEAGGCDREPLAGADRSLHPATYGTS